ncbi:MAG: hypothetical protein ACT4O4_08440, partial [Nitrospiraceae bacterium]
MKQIPHQQLRRIGLLICLVAGAFLVSHSVNALVADALSFGPDRPTGSGGDESALPISYEP